MTVTATGPISKAFAGIARLIAACPTFQDMVGAVDAAGALVHVHYPSVKMQLDGTEAVGYELPSRPWCLLTMDQSCQFNFDFATQRANGQVLASWEFPIDADDNEDSPDALLRFGNAIGAIMIEMATLAGTTDAGGNWYWNVTVSEAVQPPARCTYEECADPNSLGNLFYAASNRISWV